MAQLYRKLSILDILGFIDIFIGFKIRRSGFFLGEEEKLDSVLGDAVAV